jgi:uncharacterized lipoprotein YmbA
LAATLLVLLGGCFGTSPPSRFYSLTSRETQSIVASEKVDVIVRVGPVMIPSYLDRRQIVIRSGRNEVELAEYDLWAGTLDDEVTRLLVNTLAVRLGSQRLSVVPWQSISLADAPETYRIPVSIDRFDGTPGEKVVLNASWALIGKKDKQEITFIARESTIIESVEGKDYASLVAAMGKAVDRLGKEMSESIATLAEGK